MATAPRLNPTDVAEIGSRLAENITRAVKAPDRVVRDLIVALLADGHVLIEDAPGVGKTALARALARSLEADYARVQCTSDLLPADLVGTNVFNQRAASFEFHPGPVFANVVLVDEINRTPPRTQAALLEPMEERQVTVEGSTHLLPEPYVVIATENPIEQHGTYPLPEGQLDRFALSVRVGYPEDERSGAVVRRQLERHPLRDLEQAISPEEVVAAQHAVRAVYVDDAVVRYAVELVTATRTAPGVALGASPRSSVALVRCAQARAIAQARDHALPDDVKALAVAALGHRLVMAHGGLEAARATVEHLLGTVAVPLHVARSG
jgi:MoxR-like ATPase